MLNQSSQNGTLISDFILFYMPSIFFMEKMLEIKKHIKNVRSQLKSNHIWIQTRVVTIKVITIT